MLQPLARCCPPRLRSIPDFSEISISLSGAHKREQQKINYKRNNYFRIFRAGAAAACVLYTGKYYRSPQLGGFLRDCTPARQCIISIARTRCIYKRRVSENHVGISKCFRKYTIAGLVDEISSCKSIATVVTNPRFKFELMVD